MPKRVEIDNRLSGATCDAELVDDLEGVFATVLDVDEGVVERGTVVAGEAVDLAERGRGGEDVGGDDLVKEAAEFAVGQLDAVEGSSRLVGAGRRFTSMVLDLYSMYSSIGEVLWFLEAIDPDAAAGPPPAL
jgi:hypothetical protein